MLLCCVYGMWGVCLQDLSHFLQIVWRGSVKMVCLTLFDPVSSVHSHFTIMLTLWLKIENISGMVFLHFSQSKSKSKSKSLKKIWVWCFGVIKRVYELLFHGSILRSIFDLLQQELWKMLFNTQRNLIRFNILINLLQMGSVIFFKKETIFVWYFFQNIKWNSASNVLSHKSYLQ